jgi:hypothetical protein
MAASGFRYSATIDKTLFFEVWIMPKFQDYYPKTEYQRSDFITDTKIIRDLIFAIQQATIMQVWLMATRSRVFIYGVIDCSAEAPGRCLNPVFRHCDPMEACAHGAPMTGMKPS